MSVDPTTAMYLDGPGIVAWLEEGLIIDSEESPRYLHPNHRSAIERWRRGSAASIYTADEVLCKLGVCLGELPDDLWREPPETSANAIGGDIRARILRLWELGWNYADIGRIVGCDKKTAKSHILQEAA
jgi:hypothetical protein